MLIVYDKIVLSKDPPKTKTVLWANPETNELKYWGAGEWEPFFGYGEAFNTMNRDGSNYIGDLELVTPKIKVEWTVYNDSSKTKKIYTDSNIQVELGAKVSCKGNFYYDAPNKNQKIPSRYGGTLTENNSNSLSPEGKQFSQSNITNNKTFTIDFYSGKSGLEVRNNKIVKASGEDKTSNSISVTFKHRLYWGTSEFDDLTDYNTLSTELSTSRKKSTTFNCSGGKYFYYVYPKALGKSTWKVGGLAFSGYELKEVSIINEYGKSIEYYVYRSKDIQYGGKINVEIT